METGMNARPSAPCWVSAEGPGGARLSLAPLLLCPWRQAASPHGHQGRGATTAQAKVTGVPTPSLGWPLLCRLS